MVSNDADSTEEICDLLDSQSNKNDPELRDVHVTIPSPTTRSYDQRSHIRRLLDILRAHPSGEWFSVSFSSPFSRVRRAVDEKEEISLSVPSPVGVRGRFHSHFIRKIYWPTLLKVCKEWLKNPRHIALTIWLLCVAVSATMLGLLLVGLLDGEFPSRASRKRWVEINNQVLNALFTLMSLYEHPNLFHHLVLLFRWRSEDIIELRKVFCKNGAYRPHEWAHMMVVVVLLHITCFSQYVLCGLYWEYKVAERPEFAETFFVALGVASPVIASAYTVYSPLGRMTSSESDEESQVQICDVDIRQPNKVGLKLYDRRLVVSRPEWVGGLFDCKDDMTVCCLSFCCTCCVFGWNMERLGFGNMYLHLFTFLLLCIAPFFIFNISATNIHNETIADIVAITGRVLSVFGLLYGGYWRIEMRKRFKLPGNRLCCGSEALTDYMQWMFCCACSLAQEVRTGNFYDVEDDSLFRKDMGNTEENHTFAHSPRGDGSSGSGHNEETTLVHSPHREGSSGSSFRSIADSTSLLTVTTRSTSPSTTATGEKHGGSDQQLLVEEEESSERHIVDATTPPIQQSMKSEAEVSDLHAVELPLSHPSIQI